MNSKNNFKVQSVVLPKDKFNLEKAELKVEELGYKTKYMNKRVNEYKAGQTINFWRFRQMSPLKFEKNYFRMKKLDNGGFLVIGKLK
jgi:hypothetical protein